MINAMSPSAQGRRLSLKRAEARLRFGRRALAFAARHPVDLLRIAASLGGSDGWPAGVALGHRLDNASKRAAAAALLAEEFVSVRFLSDGFRWEVPSGDRILADMLGSGEYEGRERRAVVEWVRSNPALACRGTVVEVGANVGTTTLPLVRDGFRVVAIEPVPRTFDYLQSNLEANGLLDKVHLVREACSLEDGPVRMRVAGGGSEIVTGAEIERDPLRRLEYASFRGAGSEETVRARPLSSIIAAVNVHPDDVAFVWSDTEGHEAAVIETGAAIWESGAPAWIELWPSGLRQHSGIPRFTQLCQHFFGHFILSDELTAGEAAPRPIKGLEPYIEQRLADAPGWWSTDVLLVPRPLIP
jgi:FkbM family methyltransferase